MPSKQTTTAEGKALFLQAIHRGMKVKQAAKYAHVDRTTPYDWELRDPDFAKSWAETRATRPRMIEDTVFEIAVEGNVPLLKWLIHFQRNRREQPQPLEIRIIQQEVLPDGSHQDFFTISP
jgi:hypothetical protein